MHRARCALPHLPSTVCPRLGSGKLGVRLVAHSQLILLRVRLVLRLAAGWRRPPAPAAASSLQVPLTLKNYLFLRRARPQYRNPQTKKSAVRYAEPFVDRVLSQQKIFLENKILMLDFTIQTVYYSRKEELVCLIIFRWM